MTTALITGINGRLALLVAGLLATQPDMRVVGVDRVLPDVPIAGVEVHPSDMRGRSMRDLLRSIGADVVVHLAQFGEERPFPGREMALRGNVLTTMELLGASVAAGVHRAVLRSSTLAYGARHNLPLFVSESTPLRSTGGANLQNDYIEVEHFAEGFVEKHPDLAIVVLRCANLVGGTISSPFARYLGQRAPSTLLGFDPLIQVLHPDDAAVAFTLAVLVQDAAGPFNLTAEGPLTLGHAIRLAGRQPLPLPGPVFDITRLLGAARSIGELPFDIDFLRYPCVADARRARDVLGWEPKHTAEEALRQLSPAQEVAVGA